jgi:hypothetical protein
VSGNRLKEWLRGANHDYTSLRDMMSRKFKSPEDSLAMNNMQASLSAILGGVHREPGESYDSFARAMIDLSANEPHFVASVVSEISNLRLGENYDASDFVLQSLFSPGFYRQNQQFFTDMKDMAAQRANANASNQAGVEEPEVVGQELLAMVVNDIGEHRGRIDNRRGANLDAGVDQQPVADQGFYDAVLGNDSEQPPGASNNRTGVRNDGMIIIHP